MIIALIIILIIIAIVLYYNRHNEYFTNPYSIEYNVNYPSYINVAKLSMALHASPNYKSMLRTNILLKKKAKQYNISLTPTSDLINQSLIYTNGQEFYDKVIIDQYDRLFHDALNINIIKTDIPINNNLLSVG